MYTKLVLQVSIGVIAVVAGVVLISFAMVQAKTKYSTRLKLHSQKNKVSYVVPDNKIISDIPEIGTTTKSTVKQIIFHPGGVSSVVSKKRNSKSKSILLHSVGINSVAVGAALKSITTPVVTVPPVVHSEVVGASIQAVSIPVSVLPVAVNPIIPISIGATTEATSMAVIQNPEPTPTTLTPTPITNPTPLLAGAYGIDQNGTFEESGGMSESTNAVWWLNSGAYFSVSNGIIKTIQGKISINDPWHVTYASANSEDTDNGDHPQNIFRLITTSTWKNVTQQAYFTVNAYNLSASSNRAEYNGFLFFNHYVDSQNLYYAGLRVDGTAVIKKKSNGTYYTMDQETVFPGTYDHDINPNLIPTHTSIGIKSVLIDNPNGSVSIKLYIDKNHDGTWTQVAQATDSGSDYGPVISTKSYAGIRTDFMDVEFTDYMLSEI